MKFLEKDLEEIIFTSDVFKLLEKGFYDVPLKMKRQLNLGNYGRPDLVGLSYDNRYSITHEKHITVPVFSVIELKQDRISVSSFLQALNYLKGVKHYLSKHKKNLYKDAIYKLVLIGKSIDDSGSFVYLPELLSSDDMGICFYTYDYGIDGIIFKSHKHYSLLNPGF